MILWNTFHYSALVFHCLVSSVLLFHSLSFSHGLHFQNCLLDGICPVGSNSRGLRNSKGETIIQKKKNSIPKISKSQSPEPILSYMAERLTQMWLVKGLQIERLVWIIWVGLLSSEGSQKEEGKRVRVREGSEDATLLVLKTEETMSLGTWWPPRK
jgi:hypothetical protein